MKKIKAIQKQIKKVDRAFSNYDSYIYKLSSMLSEESGVDGLTFVVEMQPGDGLVVHPLHDGDEYEEMLLIKIESILEALPLSDITDLPSGI